MTGAPGPVGDRAGRTLLVGALLANTVVVLPNIMLGAMAVLVRDELGFGEATLGVVFAAFAAAALLTSAPGGRLSERVGAARTMTTGAVVSGVALVGVATLAQSVWTLGACMVVGGVGNGLTQPATNGVLSGVIDPRRQGLAFGVKQASIPLAGLLSGIALPVLGVRVGWRWAFAAGAALAIAVAAVVPRAAATVRARDRPDVEPPDGADAAPLGPLLVITVAVALASMSANAIGAFFVESIVASGVAAGTAGAWLIAGGVCGIVARPTWGWLADRRTGGHLRFVAGLILAGAVGLGLLALRPAGGVLLAAATALAYGATWGWPGLFNYAIVRQSRGAPSAATGVTQSGVFAGVLIGPTVFGALVETVSYRAAWSLFAGVSVVAACLLLVGRRLLLRARRAEAAAGP